MILRNEFCDFYLWPLKLLEVNPANKTVIGKVDFIVLMQQKHYNDHGGFEPVLLCYFILNKKWIPFFFIISM
jgi:hypothetical protein